MNRFTLISIHAPPRGATSKYFCPYRCRFISIHAPPRGATHADNAEFRAFVFQFTPLREGRPHPTTEVVSVSDFNSRPSARGDVRRLQTAYPSTRISIHAPPRGATLRQRQAETKRRFQFTPLREGRPDGQCAISAGRYISIHAPPRGATKRGRKEGKHMLFQFTPLREGRRARC